MTSLDRFRRYLPSTVRDRLVLPGSEGYAAATAPRNATADQRPAAVLLVAAAEHVSAAVRAAAEADLKVAPQASGHGAAGRLRDDTVLLDTSGLDTVTIDAERRIARVGAGATFGDINAAAFGHGLLAPGGTAPDVAVVGYTVWGGVGWLTRPHGLASAALVAADVVDGHGELRRVDDSGSDIDRDVLWVLRGGGGAGVVTAVELRLYPAADLYAGFALWPATAAPEVLGGWGGALGRLHPAVSSAAGILSQAPDAPTVPPFLRGQPAVHLSAATVDGGLGRESLHRLLTSLSAPEIDTFGPCDAARLSTIHLDPPAAVPAVGEGRWLTKAAADRVHDILTAADGIGEQGRALAEVELRHVAAPPSPVSGAMTSVPAPLLLHATGAAPDPDARRAVLAALAEVTSAAQPADAGLSATSFRDGRAPATDALPADSAARAMRIRRAVDPDEVITTSRVAG